MINIIKNISFFKKKDFSDRDPGFWEDLWYHLRKNKTAMFGLYIIIVIILMAILAPLISLFDPLEQVISDRLLPPFSGKHILGTDDLGRDLLSRIFYGARISVVIGFFSVSISLFFGIIIGMISGYIGGITDKIIMRLIDIMLAFPYILLTIVVVSLLGPSLINAMLAIAIAQVPHYVRIMRASVLAEKENDYVTAEKSLGASHIELMFKSILPNCLAPLIVQATLGIGSAILESAALSFLGLGAQPPTPEWGLMIASSKEFISSAWWVVTFPGIAILFAVLGFNLLGDGIRDVLDPRLKD